MLLQQGDVLLEKVQIPESKKETETGQWVETLAEGEATGHAHRLLHPAWMFGLTGTSFFIRVKKRTQLMHEEHGAIAIDPGVYAIRIVREYDHFREEARAVQD